MQRQPHNGGYVSLYGVVQWIWQC